MHKHGKPGPSNRAIVPTARKLGRRSNQKPARGKRDDDKFHQPADKVGSYEYTVELHESSIGEDQRQRACQPHDNRQYDRAANRMNPQLRRRISEYPAGH